MEDLSSLCKGLTGGESMSAANGISVPPPFTSPGSASEATSDVTPRDPSVDVPAVSDHTHRVS